MHAVVVGGHFDECVPDTAGVRHKGLVPDSAGRRQLPDSDEHDHREQRKSGAGEPNAPLRRAWDGARPTRFLGDDVDKYRHYAKDFL
ncbi:Uncharacterised protein [Mycobacteroides abscessus subsp. abscessus]|nr:Uncharacterised protein [Mycobacteroides abscessus subsp. abscessus]